MKKFSNHYQEMKRKRGICGTKDGGSKVKPLNLFEETSGRRLFEEEHKDSINNEAKQRRLGSSSISHAGHYQAILKEMWDAVDDDEKEKYEKDVQDHSADVVM